MLRSTAEMWTDGYDVMVGFSRLWAVRTMGPQALSRIRRVGVVVGGEREGMVREMSWLARMMSQPPVRWS